jgi:DNA adenine methylase
MAANQPFAYYGGKQRMAHNLLPLIPQHAVYCEPFCGGATLFWQKNTPKVTNSRCYREVLNDSNHHIINFFDVMKTRGDELCHELEYTPYSQEKHAWAKAVWRGDIDVDDLQKAAAFFINANMSFAKDLNSGWGTGVSSSLESISFLNKKAALPAFIARLKSVYLSCEDAMHCIARWDSPQTFFYCDPPYIGTNQGHYAGYSQQDFDGLVAALDACQGSFMLSSYHMDNIPPSWERFDFAALLSAALDKTGDKRRTEVVWRRFEAVDPTPDVLKLYETLPFQHLARKPGRKKAGYLF